MALATKKSVYKSHTNRPLAREFDSSKEGAKAKADYLMDTVLKNFDWDAFMAQKQAQTSKK